MDKAGRWILRAVVLLVLGFKDCNLVSALKATRAVTDMRAIIMKAKEVVTVFTCGEMETFTRGNGRKVSSMGKAVSLGLQVLLTVHYCQQQGSVNLIRII
jgi:hypothetical protein